MARTAQRQSPPRDSGLGCSTELSETRKTHPIHLAPSGDSASDGDAGERPIREKLKKTSIASIPKYGIAEAHAILDEPEEHPDTVMASQEATEETPPEIQQVAVEFIERGRPHKKRSFDDIDAVETSKEDPLGASMSAHARKRSRDVRSVEGKISASRRRSPEVSVQEEIEALESQKQDSALRDELEDTTIKENVSKPPSETADHEMQESVLSPKKKRSRDQFESESHREQKIAATDENRARRRSSEEDRPVTAGSEVVESNTNEQSNQNGNVIIPTEPSIETEAAKPKLTLPPGSGFANTSAASPFSTLSGKPSVFKSPSSFGTNTSNQETQTSSSAFASSGFAALAGPSTSGFSTFGTASNSTKPPLLDSRSPVISSTTTETSTLGGFGSSAPGGFGSAGKSSFVSLGASGFGALGASTFGSPFGRGFGGGSKLSSFAAPVGDTKLGSAKPKIFGASENSDEEDSTSEGGDDHVGDGVEETEAESGKFQLQEGWYSLKQTAVLLADSLPVETGEQGEDTIFSNRGKLYRFVEKKWAERGVGLFKLNVRRQDAANDVVKGETTSQPRFVMRTQATHKVILNAPVFKGMKISDLEGKEPSGKAAMFSVYVEGKLTPHLLKVRLAQAFRHLSRPNTDHSVQMSKEDDIKALYHKVQRLQKDL
ncbi:hypothetical protein MMC15_000155 [Xylographa vitiligo]|nr:hypothetical protein [Xylographa vitiligo]